MSDTSLEKEMQALRADLAKLRDDIAGVAEAAKEAGKQKAEGARESISGLVETLREEMKVAFDTVQAQGKKSVEVAESSIAERPFLSLLTALGLGVLVGQLISRK